MLRRVESSPVGWDGTAAGWGGSPAKSPVRPLPLLSLSPFRQGLNFSQKIIEPESDAVCGLCGGGRRGGEVARRQLFVVSQNSFGSRAAIPPPQRQRKINVNEFIATD